MTIDLGHSLIDRVGIEARADLPSDGAAWNQLLDEVHDALVHEVEQAVARLNASVGARHGIAFICRED